VLEFPLPASSSILCDRKYPSGNSNCQVQLQLCFRLHRLQLSSTNIKFNCNCTSGILRLQLSSTNFQVQLFSVVQDISVYNCLLPFFSTSIVTVLPDYSGYDCFLRFQSSSGVYFSELYLLINIYLLSLSNSSSTKNLATFDFDSLI
jgi:hypothetical protein